MSFDFDAMHAEIDRVGKFCDNNKDQMIGALAAEIVSLKAELATVGVPA